MAVVYQCPYAFGRLGVEERVEPHEERDHAALAKRLDAGLQRLPLEAAVADVLDQHPRVAVRRRGIHAFTAVDRADHQWHQHLASTILDVQGSRFTVILSSADRHIRRQLVEVVFRSVKEA